MTSLADTVLAFRTALPSHDLKVAPGALRRWAIATCDAEVRHADRDFHRVAHDLGTAAAFDLQVDRAALRHVRLPHEQAAGQVLNWASHLRTHEGMGKGPWGRWAVMNAEERQAWRTQWFKLARGLVAAIRTYRAEREKVDPRDPDHSREGIFVHHNCFRCSDGRKPCVQGGPHRCEYPRARND